MNLLFALLPALFWGVLPLAVSKVGGRPIQQILGTTIGTLIVAAVVALFRPPQLDATAFGWCFLSGAFWAFGQLLQYRSFTQLGVSGGIPISVAMQLTANALVGTLFLGDWASSGQKLIGFSAVAIIVLGVYGTTLREAKEEGQHDMRGGLITLALSTVGFVGFSFFPARFNIGGLDAFLPQALGMVVASLVFAAVGRVVQGKGLAADAPLARKTWQNLGGGFIFAVAVLLYLIAIERNGVSVAASLAQMNVVIATLGSIYLLGEKKTPRELRWVYAGLCLVLLGGVLIGMTSSTWVRDLL